ncbi:MAG: biotin--[acetyl-CoA-carboxylase] ligase [Candidatus Omnitrophica bacterium]|nr:biotin--[acetyl-CoA-carboxylase] ligase [Candidatus Omnitrophota bacterium]
MKNDLEIKGKIIWLLRDSKEGYISGESISKKLGFSRAYLWKYISELRDDGYSIDAEPHKGYSLRSSPDKLFDFEVKRLLRTQTIGKNGLYYYSKISSTNDTAYALAEEGVKDGAVVIAEVQTGGKGRLGRKWVSPPGGLYFSLVLRPGLPLKDVQSVTLLAASAVSRSILNVTGVRTGIKWPNDVFFKDKKICGILTEVKAHPDKLDYLILGVGVNVNTPVSKLPAMSTSIKDVANYSTDRRALLSDILFEFEARYNELKDKGFGRLREECKKYSILLGNKVKITLHDRIIEGIAEDIDEIGALVVAGANGKKQRIFSGDVELCRM